MNALLGAALVVALAAIVYLVLRQRRMQQRFQRQLESEVNEKQQIISLVNHDIKAPFTRIAALEQLITLDDNALSPNQKDYLDRVHQVVADGLSLIRNLVDYRNIEYRKLEIIPEKIDLSRTVLSTLKRFKSLADKKQLHLEADIEPDLAITSDNTFVTRAIDNVLSNAIKFSPYSKTIHVTLKGENGRALLRIKDQAEGFTEEDLKSLFRKFQKLSAKPTSGESTTGLGLYITRTMLSKIGGKIKCITQVGEGSTFIIDLPRELA
jgi:signal transduction histidine kinase